MKTLEEFLKEPRAWDRLVGGAMANRRDVTHLYEDGTATSYRYLANGCIDHEDYRHGVRVQEI